MTSMMKRQNGGGNPFQQHRLLAQIKDKPISFVRAKNPEPVAIKPASYILIKPKQRDDDDDDSNTASTPSPANTNFLPLSATSDPGSRTPSKIQKAWKKGTPTPAGLINQGVTCYMNSAIQMLMHMPAMSNYLADLLLTKKYPGSVSQVFAQLHGKLFGGKKHVFPRQLINRLDDINCMMSEWNQEDAHEYFMSLMSRLQEDSTPKGAKLNSSVLYDMFGGNLEQIVVCGGCGNESKTQQDFYDLSVNLDEKKPESRISLKRCITRFFEEEQIQKKDGYKCDECKKTTSAKKTSRINEFPEHLVVHVKRFKFVNEQPKKMGAPLDYPADLDLGHYSRDKDAGTVPYKLIGVIAHCGRTTGSGHYIAHVRQPSGKWATYDDDLIEPLSEKKALKEEDAYMLMYQRLTPQASKPASGAKSIGMGTKKAAGRVTKPVVKTGKGQRKMADIDNIFASAKRKKNSGFV
ncbi:putative ubiquitin carboxyl-terminal hydrolase 16 [Yarrowia sp. C11]|nr:putative ubiquitin carboxyl-terminal hydrolase 16 [Yarrowia sp. E02]KAG5367755.1 putative ubiquitin carboxyl-terminal hydrolase 16 [Yarrowia sp. C11]